MVIDDTTFAAGPITAALTERLDAWHNDGLPARFWNRDATLWSLDPVPELADRLGWIDLPMRSRDRIAEWESFARGVAADDVVLLGMGGSSLAPEVLHAIFGAVPARPALTVLDSTHPDAVTAVAERIDPGRTLFIVSSKSGSTIETMSFFHYFWEIAAQQMIRPGAHFVAITDPGTSLAALAAERGFARVFEAPPDVGGRYSALSAFGMVPAALTGVDTGALLARIGNVAPPIASTVPAAGHPAIALGAFLGECAAAGRDKLTIVSTPGVAPLAAWIEQLVAESTGKDGRGLLPVTARDATDLGAGSDDRLIVSIELAGEAGPDPVGLESAGHPVARIQVPERLALGREFYRWEVAVALSAVVIGVHPFDQPDVQLAKDLARQAMASSGGTADGPAVIAAGDAAAAMAAWLEGTAPREYVAIHAYLAPRAETTAALDVLARALSARTGLPVTVDYGPRFLHSTGQLHKGGPPTGRFLQILDASLRDERRVPVAVPGTEYTFDRLLAAQAAGDASALARRSPVMRLETDGPAALESLAASL